MRISIFLGLLVIAEAINENTLTSDIPTSFAVFLFFLLAMDVVELIVKMDRK